MAGHVPLRDRILVLSRGGKRVPVFLSLLILMTASSAVALSVIRFSPAVPRIGVETVPIQVETELRFSANPFPAD